MRAVDVLEKFDLCVTQQGSKCRSLRTFINQEQGWQSESATHDGCRQESGLLDLNERIGLLTNIRKGRWMPMGSIKSVLVGITFLCGACAGPQEPESVADSTQQVTQAISAQAPIPDPPGLIKRGDTRALLQKNQAHRARIEALKQQIEGLVDGSSKDALLQELEQESAGYRASREGLIDSPDPTIAPPSGPKELSAAQLASLREKMVGLDMQKPADAAKWAKIKHEELGR